MPDISDRLKIELPLGNETFTREKYRGALETIDEAAATKEEMEAHEANATIHITGQEREEWNAKADAADLTGLEETVSGVESALAGHTGDSTVHVTPAEKAAWNEAASGASPTALYASAGDLPSATIDSQATKGKALVGSVTTDTAAGTQVISLALGSQALAYGTYSCVVRLKSSYSGSAGTNFLTLKVEHVSGDAPTTLGTAAIRDSDVYRTDNYCVFAMGFDFLGPWAEGDSFCLAVEAAAAVEATISLDYVAVNLAGATLLTL